MSLSSNGSILAVGGPNDNFYVGATWLFKDNGSGGYTQLGDKLVGLDYEGTFKASQGKGLGLRHDARSGCVGRKS